MSETLTANGRVQAMHIRPSRGTGVTREDLQMMECTRAARDLLASKWKIDLLYLLARGVHRYSRLYDHLKGASKKMLTESLRGLEHDGFVERVVYAEVPVRVEYSLTALGWSATELLMAMADWAQDHLPEVEQARTDYRRVQASITAATDRAFSPERFQLRVA
jgi:DNA-binding HxlR family transcriptional regulator